MDRVTRPRHKRVDATTASLALETQRWLVGLGLGEEWRLGRSKMSRRGGEHASVVHQGTGGAGPNVSRAVVIITCVTAVVAMVRGGRQPTATADSLLASSTPAADVEAAPLESTVAVEAPISEQVDAEGMVPRIGIVAGHWGSDDGASCSDGLTEVEVNLSVAELVVQSLRGLGYRVDLLEEYDDRLDDYLADALVSIHADSCKQFVDATPPPTGFKVASVVDSVVPEEEQRLVECLTEAYAERTGMVIHENSITGHMTGYHTFYAIDGHTPGAIIETGFLWLDRDLLTQQPDLVAQGIVDGIVCFVEGE